MPQSDAFNISDTSKSSWKALLNSNKQKTRGEDDELIGIAIKKRADSIKFTQFMLKSRLTQELDQIIGSHLHKNSEMRNDYFIGIILEEPYRTEVMDLETASTSVIDLPKDEAHSILSKNPVGYFKPNDFTIKTPKEEKFYGLKNKLDDFFARNASTFHYLKNNPNQDIQADSLYHPPGQ